MSHDDTVFVMSHDDTVFVMLENGVGFKERKKKNIIFKIIKNIKVIFLNKI